MGRLIGIDFGLKRIGIAETDDAKIIASPLTTINNNEIFSFLIKYFEAHDVEKVILGYPRRLDGSDTHITADVIKFKAKIENTFKKEVVLLDERFTSKMASAAIGMSGLKKKKKQEKGLIDKISASIILSDYLNSMG
ncbi:MAG: Holliday junction resolvase RuvX [Crocinitomicaceae bacterium]|nr:Holliday junction resolvase RuvX [Crocinitomicaceae bacterium]